LVTEQLSILDGGNNIHLAGGQPTPPRIRVDLGSGTSGSGDAAQIIKQQQILRVGIRNLLPHSQRVTDRSAGSQNPEGAAVWIRSRHRVAEGTAPGASCPDNPRRDHARRVDHLA